MNDETVKVLNLGKRAWYALKWQPIKPLPHLAQVTLNPSPRQNQSPKNVIMSPRLSSPPVLRARDGMSKSTFVLKVQRCVQTNPDRCIQCEQRS